MAISFFLSVRLFVCLPLATRTVLQAAEGLPRRPFRSH